MESAAIALNAQEETPICVAALERRDDPQLVASRVSWVLDLVEASPDDLFVFCSSGAEAVNQILWSVFFEVCRKQGKNHLLVSAWEDAPTLQMMKRLEEMGCFVKPIPVDKRGQIDCAILAAEISPRTALISVTMAQGLTGIIQPVEEIARLAKSRGVLLHLEGAYAVGKYAFRFADLGADYLSFSGALLHGPIGSGALIARRGAPLIPLILGGKGLRAEPFDVVSCLSFCAAAQQARLCLDSMSLGVARLRNRFEERLLREIPETKILFREELRLPNTTLVAFLGVHQEALLQQLSHRVKGAIGGGYLPHLSALLAASYPHEATSAISFALHRMTTEAEIEEAVHRIKEAVCKLRSVSWALFSRLSEDNRDHVPLSSAPFRYAGLFTQQEAEAKQMRWVVGEEENLRLYWLVDESDGVIADAKFQAFGPMFFLAAAETSCELVLRKTHRQASRLSADLIERHLPSRWRSSSLSEREKSRFLNGLISAIDLAVQQCVDIVCRSDYDTTPIEKDFEEIAGGIPGWEAFPLEKRRSLIEIVLEKEIRPYIELDAGGVEIVDLKEDGELSIIYQGNCTSCAASTGSTLLAIAQILRARVHPSLRVVPVT
jgi:cysteine desulfurase